MCTHKSGPPFLVETLENGASMGSERSESLSLKSWIEENPSVLGDKVVEKWGVNLPFLFKVCLFLFCHYFVLHNLLV